MPEEGKKSDAVHSSGRIVHWEEARVHHTEYGICDGRRPVPEPDRGRLVEVDEIDVPWWLESMPGDLWPAKSPGELAETPIATSPIERRDS
jgi:hypothetical protein